MGQDLYQRAVDPLQYDQEDLDWKGEHDLTSPSRAFAWEYLSKYRDEFKGKNVLDVGAGTGGFVTALKEAGAKSVTAIEPSKKNFAFLKEAHADIVTINTTLEEFKSEEVFDVVLLAWVVNHIGDLDAAYKKLYDLLDEDGLLLLVTPDFDYGRTPRFGYDIEVYDLDEETAVAVTHRSHGEMVDLYRTTNVYIDAAKRTGFKLVEHVPLLPTETFMAAKPKFREFADQPISHLLAFKKS